MVHGKHLGHKQPDPPFIETGQTVAGRINDRGPFVEGRIIDLSFAAAKRLGVYVPGTAPVRVEVLSVVEEENRRSER